MEVRSSMIEVATGDGSMPALQARPIADGKYPAVIVVMEAFGLNEHIKDVARRVAAEGYVTIAPDVYYREKDSVVGYDNLPEAIRLMGTLQDDRIVADVDSVIRHLQAQDEVRGDRIGIMGFCMGGRISFLTACRSPGLKAAAPFYGGGIAGLLDLAPKLACPALLFFGDQDAFIPNAEIDQIRTTLGALDESTEVKVYPGAEHGFFCNERDSYQSVAATDAWERLRKFFALHLAS